MSKTLSLMFLMPTLSVAADGLPSGWILSTKDQYLEENINWYKGNIPNKIDADFNGDKILDSAWVLTNKEKSKWGLFVSLSKTDGEHTIVKLDENKIKNYIFVGISTLEAGEHKTACGKGYWDCAQDEKPILMLKNPAIDYFVFESANSVFYWSENESRFTRVWLSD